MPPEYESPREVKSLPLPPIPAIFAEPRQPGLRLEDTLHAQLDQAIADFTNIRLVEATPVRSPASEYDDVLVSPINDIDILYLERRRQMRRMTQQEEQ